jgi:hypothetical protein
VAEFDVENLKGLHFANVLLHSDVSDFITSPEIKFPQLR